MRLSAIRSLAPALSATLFLLPAGLSAQTPPAADPGLATGVGQILVRSVRFTDVDTSRLRIAVDLTLTPTRSLTVQDLRLSGLRFNGLPIFADPYTDPIPLVKGEPATLPPLVVTVNFRDLKSVAPLRDMVSDQKAHVTGTVVADLKVSFLEKLALRSEHPRISQNFAQDVPIVAGDSPMQRQALLAALSAVQMGLDASQSLGGSLGGRIPGLESDWVAGLADKAHDSLFEVESTYSLADKTNTYPIAVDQIAFRLPSGKLVTTSEASSPWQYDSEFLGKIKDGEAKLVPGGPDMHLMPAGPAAATPLVLSHSDFSIEKYGEPIADSVIVEKKGSTKIKLLRRASPYAVCALVLPSTSPAPGLPLAPASVQQQDVWTRVAVFRLVENPAGTGRTVEVVQLTAHRQGKGIHFDQPVDASAFGSPIVTPEGVLGMVQDEQDGTFLPPELASAGPMVQSGHGGTR